MIRGVSTWMKEGGRGLTSRSNMDAVHTEKHVENVLRVDLLKEKAMGSQQGL